MTSRFVFWLIGLLMFTAAATLWLPAEFGFLSAVTLALVWCHGLERSAQPEAHKKEAA